MGKAATHMGTCQLCGRFQKLPGGRLSKHGYTVEWGFFSGTCNGADGLPFEQSTDLIEAAIASAKENIRHLTGAATGYETEVDPQAVWVHEYTAPTWQNRKGGYEWRRIPIDEIEIKTTTIEGRVEGTYNLYTPYYTKRDGKTERVASSGAGFTRDLTVTYREQNARYAISLRRIAAEYERYVAWQTKRVAEWKPADLKPVKAEQ